MEQTKNITTINALPQLLAMHNLRSEGYEKASNTTTDPDLKMIFSKLGSESREYNVQLSQELANYGDGILYETNRDLPFYSVWENTLQAFSTGNKTSLLDACLQAEEAIVETYNQFLTSLSDIPESVEELLKKQKQQIEHSNQLVKSARQGNFVVAA